MTEGNEDGDYLVRVRAQVMTRDDSSGGWVPLGGGGLSNVSVRKRPMNKNNLAAAPTAATDGDHSLALALQYEYLIHGQRISDSSTVLSCIIKRDFEYNKVMPTFHHWKTGERRFGLTFQAAADARAFDKGVRTAVEELLDVEAVGRAYPLATAPTRHLRLLQQRQFRYEYRAADLLAVLTPSFNLVNEGLVGSSSPMLIQNADDDDDVFMTLNLPVERGDSRSSSDSSARGGSRHATPPTCDYSSQQQHHHLHRISYLSRQPLTNNGSSNGSSDSWPRITEGKTISPDKEHLDPGVPDNYSYVQLTAVHEYTYPMMDDRSKKLSTSGDSLKKLSDPGTLEAIPANKAVGGRKSLGYARRLRCKYCQEIFTDGMNRKGACDYAPDKMRNVMDKMSCMPAAQGMTYHCMSDSEGDFAQRPCQCGSPLDDGCAKRWIGLAILSIFIPCLCLYPPLRACHWCCVACGACGGRHVAAEQ